jgi:choline dehydrogenase-like flavoprotein
VEFDYVIVGGGTAGCVIARRLADADPDASIGVIEGGDAFEHDPLVLGYHGSVPLLGNPTYDYDYGIAPQERGNSRIRHSRAKMLGGCSGHNDTVAFIPPARDLREWEGLGARGWGAEACRAHYARGAEQVHVHRAAGTSACAHAVHESALELGLPEVDVHGDDLVEGAGWLYLNERDEVRQSTAVAYLYPLSEMPSSITLLLETWVERLEVAADGSARTVRTSRGPVTARREVILAAGAIDTPRLLLLSGIGPSDELAALGIDPVHDLQGVGRNLWDHIEIPLVLETDRETGPSLQSAENGVFIRTRDGLEGFDAYAHIITQPYYAPLTVDGVDVPMPARGFCIVPNVAKPSSVGSLRLASSDPNEPPVIDPRYFTDPDGEDERVLVEAMRYARRMVRETALRDWVVREALPVGESDEEIAAYVRESSNTVYHPSGTCRMGAEDDAGAVVDPALRVRGLDGVRIADASIFPSIPSVNLCLTTIMVGERAADLVLDGATSLPAVDLAAGD